MSQFQVLSDEIDIRIKRLERIRTRVQQIPLDEWKEKFPQGHWVFDILEDTCFTLPFDLSLSTVVMAFIEELGHRLMHTSQHVWSQGTLTAARRFSISAGEGVYYEVVLRSEEDGSTCVIRELGKTTKIETEYEVVCSEAAK